MCPILLKECPFNEQKFVQRIQLGRSLDQQAKREFLDDLVETVISDMSPPKPITITSVLTAAWIYGWLIISAFTVIANSLFVINMIFGIGKLSSFHINKNNSVHVRRMISFNDFSNLSYSFNIFGRL